MRQQCRFWIRGRISHRNCEEAKAVQRRLFELDNSVSKTEVAFDFLETIHCRYPSKKVFAAVDFVGPVADDDGEVGVDGFAFVAVIVVVAAAAVAHEAQISSHL